jgi:hypothetical protein
VWLSGALLILDSASCEAAADESLLLCDAVSVAMGLGLDALKRISWSSSPSRYLCMRFVTFLCFFEGLNFTVSNLIIKRKKNGNKQYHSQTNKQTSKQTNKQMNKQTDNTYKITMLNSETIHTNQLLN